MVVEEDNGCMVEGGGIVRVIYKDFLIFII